MYRGNRNRERNEDRYPEDRDREYGFRQSHGGRDRFPGGEWGSSSEFGRNSEYRESDSYENRRRERDRNRERPFDMDNYYSGRQFSVGGVDFDREEADDDLSNREYNRSRFAEPYTGGQFSRGQYGMGARSGGERRDTSEEDRYFSMREREQERNYSGKGPKGYKRSDERIREEVCEALFRSPMVDASDIDVTVKDGNVTLRGTVESRSAKREAESCLENLSGIEDIHNELRLKTSGQGDLSGMTGKSNQGNETKTNRQAH